MNGDRWNHVDRLLQSALDVPLAERERFLRNACGGDDQLEREVRSLLAAHDRAGSFLDGPAVDRAGRELAGEHDENSSQDGGPSAAPGPGLSKPLGARIDSLIGQTRSHYRIVERIGAGGMGVLYKAEDTRLGRPVALKFVSDELSRDHEALDRFAREAKTASALNHPNICTIHDIGEQDGRSFIVMEYLEGTTLKDRLGAGALSVDAAVAMGVQIADALDAAHGAGIIHRDIKPANIFVTSRDRVKVLDFGLAKMRALDAPQADVITMAGTRQGVVMGTLAYMAPEQARGEPVDHRADLYSVGLVLYEMVKGTRPAAAVRLRVEASPELERIVAKCLETDRELRYQQASDLRVDLERLARGSDPAPAGRDHTPATAGVRWVVVAAAAATLAIAAVGYVFYPQPASLTDKDTIVLAEFANTTGDPVFDETLRQGLAVQLQQSPFLSLVSDERIRRTLLLMNQPPDARLTPDVARGLCARIGSAAVLDGSIAALGTQYVLGLRATNCATGDILADDQAQAARKEDVLRTLGDMATRFRTRVGETLATIEKHSTPLEEATTPSLEAFQAFSAGQAATRATFDWGRRLPHFERAIALDPDFAMAHAQIGFGLSSLGETTRGRQSLLRAYQLRQRASAAERFNIETLYDRDYTGNLERERRTLETWADTYPREPRAHSLLAGLALTSTGQHELAIAATDRALALDPDLTPTYGSKARNQLHLNRLDAALLTIRQARERQLDSPDLLVTEYLIALLKGADDDRQRIVAQARKSPTSEDLISHIETLATARSGRLRDARQRSTVPVDIAQRSGRFERAALFESATAVWEALYGNAAAARQSAARALKLGRGRDVDYAAAFALALAGDLRQSRALAEDLARDGPEDTSVQFLYLPTLRALFALNARDPAAAIQALQAASRNDLALGRLGFVARFGGLYPIYVRGLAYLAAHQPAQAAGEFQRIVNHRSIVLADPMDALARLHLARARALSGDTVNAKSAYEDLLALWKDADAGVPVVQAARAEYTRLR